MAKRLSYKRFQKRRRINKQTNKQTKTRSIKIRSKNNKRVLRKKKSKRVRQSGGMLGKIRKVSSHLPMSNSILQKFGLIFCVDRGVDYGGNPISRKKSFEFSKDFMMKTLMERN